MSTTEQTHQQDLERLKLFRYMDDDFMTACLEDNYEAVELILRIVLGQEDITIKSIRVQDSMKNLQGRSAILDVHAVDNTGKEFDCEIQRSDKGAGVKRARHNSSLLDAHAYSICERKISGGWRSWKINARLFMYRSGRYEL